MTPRTRIRLAVIATLLVCVFGLVRTAVVLDALDDTRTATVDRAYEARIAAERLESTFTRRLASGRAYMLSGNVDYLAERAQARREFVLQLAALRHDHRSLVPQLAALDDRLPAMGLASDLAIEEHTRNPVDAADQWVRRVAPAQQEILAILRAAVTTATTELVAAHATVAAAIHRARITLAAMAVASAAALALLVAMVLRGHRDLIRGALRVQERELLQILEQVPVGVSVRAADGSPYYANRVARELLGAPGAQGHLLYEANTDHPYPVERMPIHRALAGEDTEVSDMELHRGHDVIPLHVRGGSVRSTDGSVLYGLVAFQDIRELQRHAMRDSLTGLANRASIHQTYRRDRQVADRGGRALSVGLIDLDHFKSINDKHGHAMGDHVLQSVAATIVDGLRAADVVARWGGEEILVVMPDTDLAGARFAIDKVLTAVRGLMFFDIDRDPFEVTFSAGVATARHGEHLDAVVARADAALYKAKRAGRCRVLDETVVTIATAVLSAVVAPVN